MNSERWDRVARIYEAVLEREPSTRNAFLAEACGHDPELRHEVESLLAHDDAPLLVDRPMPEAAAAVLESGPRLTTGTTLGPYRIDGPLGVGGMGEKLCR